MTTLLRTLCLFAAVAVVIGCGQEKPVSTNKDVENKFGEKGKSMTATMEDPSVKKK